VEGYVVIVLAFIAMLLGASLIFAQGAISSAPLLTVFALIELAWFVTFAWIITRSMYP